MMRSAFFLLLLVLLPLGLGVFIEVPWSPLESSIRATENQASAGVQVEHDNLGELRESQNEATAAGGSGERWSIEQRQRPPGP